MSAKTIKAKLMERATGQPDERLLDYAVRNFSSVAYMTAERFCYEVPCEQEELMRLFQSFGTRNMLEFTDMLREVVYSDAGGPDDVQTKSLREIADLVARNEMSNIARFGELIDFELLDRLAQDVMAASEVYIIGMRHASPACLYAVSVLNAVGIRTRNIDSIESYVSNINAMDHSGLVLVFGFSRYHKGTVSLINMLKKDGFKIVAVTDAPMSPFVRMAEYSLFVPVRSHDYTVSFLASHMLITILSIYIGKLDPDALKSNLKRREEIRKSLDELF